MFSAVRVPPAAVLSLLLSSVSASVIPGASAAAEGKPKDFGTSQVSVQTLRGVAALAGIQSTSATIVNESVCSAVFDQMPPVSVSDGGGGTIVVWSDYRSVDLDIYAQKLDAAGNPVWSTDGIP